MNKEKQRINSIFLNLKKIDYKYIISAYVVILVPLLYSFIRIYFISANGSETFAMASTWGYVGLGLEILSAFLIMPLFSFTKEKHSSKSLEIFIFFSGLILFVTSLLFTFTNPLLNKMQNLDENSIFSRNELKIGLWLSMIVAGITIFEQYLLVGLVIERNYKKLYLLTFIVVCLKLIFDLLFFAPFSPIPFFIYNITISALVSSLIIISILSSLWLFEYYNEMHTFKITYLTFKEEVKLFCKRGFFPALQVFVSNFFYIFVTLKIVDSLGTLEHNAWQLSTWIYWSMLLKITMVLEYVLLSERVKDDRGINFQQLTWIFISFDFVIFLILSPLLILTIYPIIAKDSEWLKLSIQTSLLMIPFMFMISAQNKFRTKFLAENKLNYLAWNTIITNLTIQLPVFILLLFGVKINYLENLAIWLSTITLSAGIGWYQFSFYKSLKLR